MSDRESYRGGRGRATNMGASHRGGGGRYSHNHNTGEGADNRHYFPKDENVGYVDAGSSRTRGSWHNTRPVSFRGASNRPVNEYRVKKQACDSYNEVGSSSLTVPMQPDTWSSNEQSKYFGTSDGISEIDPRKAKNDQSAHSSKEKIDNQCLQHLNFEEKLNVSGRMVKSELPDEYRNDNSPSQLKETNSIKELGNSEQVAEITPFDICRSKPATLVTLKPSLLAMNRQMRNEKRALAGKNIKILRPGMILLENFLSICDQVRIVKKCREVGLGQGGFYQPGYRDGGKLHLKMMCLGKNWDPETSKYGELRPIDGAKPPIIPREFSQWVEKSIGESHATIEKDSKRSNVEDILPWMRPNICIVNFYSESGKLGFHQDKDESLDSLDKGLPVVSFSIGDSAQFLFGDERDVEKADKVELKSGDVLIFGGKSRLVFHGVSSILKDTAPKSLLAETDLRPGRLNLTFRQD